MTVYDLESIDPDAVNTSHGLIVQYVGNDRRVLDIGCSTGYLGEVLIERGCVVDGVDKDPEAVIAAQRRLNSAKVVDLDVDDLAQVLAGNTYDRIILADVLEHLADPHAVLLSASALLAPDGEIIMSIPNITHGSLRLALLEGRWEYRDTGLLDRTHIRFFNRASMIKLIQSAGLAVIGIRSTVVDPLNAEVEIDRSELPQGILSWVRAQPDSFNYQFVVRARKGVQDGDVPGVEPAVHLSEMDEMDEAVLSTGAVYEIRKAFAELRHEVASMRRPLDDVSGSEIASELHVAERSIAALRDENSRLRRSVLNLRADAIGTAAELGESRRDRAKMRHELAVAKREIAAIRASASWRVGQLIVTPSSRLRDALRGPR